jgi:putative heme-binding domain-containing protein
MGRRPSNRQVDIKILADWLGRSESSVFRDAVIERLSRLAEPEVASALLDRWNVYTPAVRKVILPHLCERGSWSSLLLDAVSKKTVLADEVPLASRQRLAQHENASIRQRASQLFKPMHPRADVVASYRSAAELTGVKERGELIFEKQCSQCHVFRGHGRAVGPDLALFADKKFDEFLAAILDPNSAIHPDYITYDVESQDANKSRGVIQAEAPTVLNVVSGEGESKALLRSEITGVTASEQSLMPEGLEKQLSRQALADLVAWVKNWEPAEFGSATPEVAARARQFFLNTGQNDWVKVTKSGEQVPYQGWLGRLPMASCRQNGTSVEWTTAPVPKSLAAPHGKTSDDVRVKFRFPVAMGYLSQPEGSFTLRVNRRPMLRFDVTLTDRTWESSDGRLRMSYTVMDRHKQDSSGILEVELSTRLIRPGRPVTFTVNGSDSQSLRWFGGYLLPAN